MYSFRFRPVRGRELALITAAISIQVAIGALVANGRVELALIATVAVAFSVASAIEPRLAFAIPLFFLLMAIHQPGGIAPTDVVFLVGPAVVAVAAFLRHPIARRASALVSGYPLWPIVIVFATIVVFAAMRGNVSHGSLGTLSPLRLAIGPLLLMSFAVFRSPAELLATLRATYYVAIPVQFGVMLWVASRDIALADVSTGGERLIRNEVALSIGVALLLATLHFMSAPKARTRLMIAGVMLMALALLVVSLNRATWIGLILGLAIIAIVSPQGRRAAGVLAAVAVPVALAGAALGPILAPDVVNSFRSRFALDLESDGSAAFRGEAWALMLDRWRDEPIFGTGFGQMISFTDLDGSTVVNINDPHNGFIFLLTSTGVVGLVAFLVLQLGTLVLAAKALRNPETAEIGLLSLAVWPIFMVNIFLGVILGINFPLAMLYWYWMLIPAAALVLLSLSHDEARDSAELPAKHLPPRALSWKAAPRAAYSAHGTR